MLIISGVAISVITGQEGMFSKVSDATKEYKKQSLIELIKNAELALELDVILSENTANPIEKNVENLMDKIKEIGNFKDGDIETEAYIEGEIGTGLIIDKTTGVVIDITMDKNGNVTTEGTIVDDVSDITRPEADVELDIPEGTYAETVTIKLTFKDEGSGIVKIQFPDGTVKTYDSEKEVAIQYPVTENGTYKFIVENANGRKSTTSVEVTNTMSVALITMENLTEEVTQGPINLKISYDANPRIGGEALTNADRYQYIIGEESVTNQWQIANTTVENGFAVATIQVPVNGIVYARYFDGTNGHKTITTDIQNIDKEKPEVFSIVANPTTGKETYSVTVTTATGSAVKDLGSDGQAELNIGIEGYQFQIKDSGGNIIKIKDSNGDATLDWSIIQSGISYTFDNTTLANNLTEGASYTITMRALDLAGNYRDASVTGTVTGMPDSYVTGTIGIAYIVDGNTVTSLGTPTKNNVKVQFTNNSGNSNLTLKYQIGATNDNGWQTYPSAGVEMSTNGTVYARLYDAAGQSRGVATANVNNIEKEKPTVTNVTPEATTNSIKVTVTASDAGSTGINPNHVGVAKYKYRIDNGSWSAETTSTTNTFTNLTQGSTHTIGVIAIDKAGNESTEYTKTGVQVSLVPTAVGNVTMGGIPTSWVKEASITLSTGVTEYTLQYKIGSGNWTPYTTGFKVSANGTVSARFVDGNNQPGTVLEQTIDKIDTAAPTTATISYSDNSSTGFTLNATGADAVQINRYEFYVGGSLRDTVTTSNTTASLAVTGLSNKTTYSCYVIVFDTAGNFLKSSSIDITTDGGSCFVENTKILTADGLRNIQDIKVGDYVYSRNDNTNEIELKPVERTFVREQNETYKVFTNRNVIEATTNHPWYVDGKGYICTKDLKQGDELVDKDGNLVEIVLVQKYSYARAIKVYNMHIKDNHNYFVGDDSYLVHNWS